MRGALFAALVVLTALITGGYCLVCETCHVEGATSCTGTQETCADGVTHCVKGLEINSFKGNVQTFAYKACVAASEQVACDRNIIHRNNILSVRIKRECCTEDSCNSGDVSEPPLDETPNGFKCPGCVTVATRSGCAETDEVLCNGGEKLCATYDGVITKKGDTARDYTHSGCNNQDACDAGVPALESPYISDTKQQCSDAVAV